MMFNLFMGVLLLAVSENFVSAFPTKTGFHLGPLFETRYLVDAINDFSRRLMSELNDDDVNIVLSPLSISSVLGMMWLGAAGDTRDEIQQVCRFRPGENVEEEFNALHTVFLSPIGRVEKQKSEVILANGLFYDQSQQLKSGFKNKLQNFRAEETIVDFKFEPEKARNAINYWVGNKTRGMIQDILPPNAVNSRTRAIITNAVYFSGNWRFPFHPYKTTMQTFTTLTGNKIQVPMLMRESKLAYRRMCTDNERGFRRTCTNVPQPDVIEIPYADGNYVMTILVPNDHFTFAKTEANLKSDYKRWRQDTLFGQVILSVPKFKVNFQTDLRMTLEKMGINKAFSRKDANFDNMSDEKIVFERFVHKSSIVVDDSGTRASASSSAITVLKVFTPAFTVDKPFFFFIEDKTREVQLFAGRITNPMKSDIKL